MTNIVVILSTADYNAAVWTNKQHLATRLAQHQRIIYIESLGLRRPKISIADGKRIMSRFFRSATPRHFPDNIRIVKPHVIPIHSNKFIQAINARLLRRQIRRLLNDESTQSVLWTFSPVTYGIESYFDKVIYHSVDLLHTQPRVPSRFLLEKEKELSVTADKLIASSRGVEKHLHQLTNKPVILWENVADTSLYIETTANQRKCRAVFAGNLTPTKIDFDLLAALANSGISVTLAGPTAIDGTRAPQVIADLVKHPNIEHVGNLEPPALAELLNACTVGIIPYALNDYTEGVFPMKVYEYLASGLSVVSTQLPSLTHLSNEDIHIVGREHFVKTVTAVLSLNFDAIARRKHASYIHSWDNRTKAALEVLHS